MNTYTIIKKPFVPVAKTGEFANPYLSSSVGTSSSSGGDGGRIIDVSAFLKVSSDAEQTVNSPLVVTKEFKALTIYEGGVLLSEKYATPKTVSDAIAALVDSSPEALNTLNELAAALGNDPNFATTVTNQIAGKAPLVHTHTISQITDIANASVASAGKLTTARIITLSGNVTGSITTDFSSNPTITTSIADTVVNSKLLTNYAIGSNAALAATDSIIGAFGKVQGQINNLVTLGTSQTISGLKNFTTAPTINSYAIWHSGNSNLSTIDWTAKNLTAAGNTKSSTFTGAGFTASGWQIDNSGNANVKSLTVRELARFYELEINKIRATNGALAVTDAAVVTSINGSVLSFDDIPPFQVGDIVRAQRWNGGTRGFIASVTAVDTANKTITVGSFTVGDATQIKAGDTIIRWNSSIAARKGLLYLTSSDAGSPNMQILYDQQVKGQFGNLEGRLFNGVALPANTYGVWVNDGYFSGSVNVTGGNAETTTGSQSKADAAKTAAINAASADAAAKVKALNDTLGTLATKSIVEASMLGTTIISGGYIKSSLLDVNTIIVNGGIAKTTDVNTAKNAAISAAATDATTKASNAQSAAITTAGTNADTKINTFKSTLGTLAYNNAVSSAMLDSTVISGGYIKNTLLDTNAIVVSSGATVPNLGNAKKLYNDEYFKDGWNGLSIYDNSGSGNVVLLRTAKDADTPTGSPYMMTCTISGNSQQPGYGGFTFASPTAANHVYIARFVAKVPSGYTIYWASNSIGDGGSSKWLTSNVGTGRYEEYIYKVVAGTSGSFSSTNFFYFSGGTVPSAGSPLVIKIASATVYDTTMDDSRMTYIDSTGVYTGTLVANQIIACGCATTNDVTTAKNSAISTASSDATSKANTAQSNAQSFTTNTIGNKFTYIDGSGIYTGTLTANQVNAVGVTALGNVTAGSFNIGSGKFVVDSSGNLTASNANITGNVTATSGKIGGFSIGTDTLSAENLNISTTTGQIRFFGSGMWSGAQAGIGMFQNLVPNMSNTLTTGYFRNNQNNSNFINIGIYADAQNGGCNIALLAKGNIVTNKSCLEYGINYVEINLPITISLSINNGRHFVIKQNSNGSLYLPYISDVQNVLGIDGYTDFCIKITVNAKYNSSGFTLYPNSDWGVIKTWNGTDYSSIAFGAGDTHEFYLCRLGSEKWVQIINKLS
jgi:hypothetical protein